jgi:putative membrane protein insertion efficiency factor
VSPVRRLADLILRGYQWLVSPLLGTNCRFHPTCSEYARQAVARHGLLRGGWLALWRLARCNPWHEGGMDPVPGQFHFRPPRNGSVL